MLKANHGWLGQFYFCLLSLPRMLASNSANWLFRQPRVRLKIPYQPKLVLTLDRLLHTFGKTSVANLEYSLQLYFITLLSH